MKQKQRSTGDRIKGMSRNELGQETSPYLLAHKDDPVHWMAWGPRALERAREEGKPIFLSIGYAACHWCHVMARESFSDTVIGELLNRDFVSIKVDREERPDVDSFYLEALAKLTERPGWPISLFLTPEGHPFWGGTYFPLEPRDGLPGFRAVVEEMARAYREEPDQVAERAADIMARITDSNRTERTTKRPDAGLLLETAWALKDAFDPERGGLRSAPKFPHPTLLRFLWNMSLRHGLADLQIPVFTTLKAMCRGGIYDHLGGGFFRYTTDEDWRIPHFEKMLYDNAQLIELLADVWIATEIPELEDALRQTVTWLLCELQLPHGAFAASLSAYSDDADGAYYLWSADEIDTLLGDQAPAFCSAYGITGAEHFDGRNVLHRLRSFSTESRDTRALADCRRRLRQAREKRNRPARDDKVLTDWNGLAIAALARASMHLDEPTWLDAAESAWRFLRENLVQDGMLMHSWRDNACRGMATLSDQASFARASHCLYECTGRIEFFTFCQQRAKDILNRYWDKYEGRLYYTSQEDLQIPLRQESLDDDVVPSGSGLAAQVLATLSHICGEPRYGHVPDAVVSRSSGEPPSNLFPRTSTLEASYLLDNPIQLRIGTNTPDNTARRLIRAARAQIPSISVIWRSGNYSGASLCQGSSCSITTDDPSLLQIHLRAINQ